MATAVNEVDQHAKEAGNKFLVRRRDYDLRACISRHRALESAWKVVALSGLSSQDHYIPMAAGSLGTELASLVKLDVSKRDPVVIQKIHACIDSLETELRSIAREVSLEQMRSVLPEQIHKDPRSVVDLLDLMLAAESDSRSDNRSRIATLDYVITALCTDGGRSSSLQDPLTLSPALYGRCEIAAEIDDPRIPGLAGEFLLASDNAKSVNLAQRKNELGELFYVPNVLRTVIAYNAALWDEIKLRTCEVDEPKAEVHEVEDDPGDATTLFVTSALPRIGEALRRRVAGEPPTRSAIDRVAWSLELDFPTAHERTILLSPLVGRRSELAGTTVLVGLLCKASNVLGEELSQIGLSANLLLGEWSSELGFLLKRESGQMIAGNQYNEACALSELRSRYLLSSVSDAPAQIRRAPSGSSLKRVFDDVREQASELASEAAASGSNPSPRQNDDHEGAMRRRIMLHVGSIALALAAAIGTCFFIFVRPDGLHRFDREQLAQVSPYFKSGRRSVEGAGSTFVGVLHDDWSQLEIDVQQVLAEEMIDALHVLGMSQIMVYDQTDALRIQSLGHQPLRLLGSAASASSAGT